MGCGKKIAAAVHIDIIVFYFSKQYNEDKKGVCFYEVSEICRENGLKAGCVACAVRIRSDLPSGKTCRECFFLCHRSTDLIYSWLLHLLRCCIYCVFQSLWLQLGLLVGIGLAVYAVLFLFVLFQEIGEHIKENLRDFIFS
jgi:hypothetical protein